MKTPGCTKAMVAPLLAGVLLHGCAPVSQGAMPAAPHSAAALSDASAGGDWPGFGRTYGEQHFSPLSEIRDTTVARLGLAWSQDLAVGNSVSGPLAVGGVLYFTTGYSLIHAVDAATGKPLWDFDPGAAEAAGMKLRQGWGSRGIAWWNGKIYTGTQDGRLIALDAATGKQLWSTMTVGKDDARFISGPPRAFDGKVIIGHGGADVGSIRGYVTAYDAETGRQLWRFYTVPGNPADGFENPAMAMAAKTWAGQWWKYGGGGTVWNAITYDPATDTVFLGTGNGAPWNRKVRSNGEGDNLFLASIVALDGKTGGYKWHYQVNPGESWDFNAAMDMELADLTIDGTPRKVLMTAPKNGFFYVIDRITGRLISAEPFVNVTWASKIDISSGRPVDAPNNRYENGRTSFSPTPIGAHSWLPMAFSRDTGLVYIPAIDLQVTYTDKGITQANWSRTPGLALDYAVDTAIDVPPGSTSQSALVAWNPVTQKAAWRVPTPVHFNGGVMATGGNLVFQGQVDGKFNAYDAATGKLLWSYAAGAPVIAPPISYQAGGRQYVTVLTGMGTSGGFLGPMLRPYKIDYRTQARRVLTFALDGTAQLPPSVPFDLVAVDDAGFAPQPAAAARGEKIYNQRCVVCHGGNATAAGTAPDLRASSTLLESDSFASIVSAGSLVANGMPKFAELTTQDRDDLRQFLRTKAQELSAEAATAAPKRR